MMTAELNVQIGAAEPQVLQVKLGGIPIMVKSKNCHLAGLSQEKLVENREEATEQGGYFIINGIERCIRLLILPRRHYVNVMTRSAFAKRGPQYTQHAAVIRCVRPDQSSQSIYVHYLRDGTCTLRFSLRKNEFLIPAVLVLKALLNCTDLQIFTQIVGTETENTFLTQRAESILSDSVRMGLSSEQQACAHLGSRFRSVLNLTAEVTDEQCGRHLLDNFVFVHLKNNSEKFTLLCYMIRKLYTFVSGSVSADNPDSQQAQEVLLPGHLFLMMTKEKMTDYLNTLRYILLREKKLKPETNVYDIGLFRKLTERSPVNIGQKLEYFLSTGNLISETGLDLMQVSGYTIVAEKLNYYRYLSHFRSIHRGAFFAEMKTTTVRKLLPEGFGFICPVHTPDGAPCGLLNHLTATCKIITEPVDASGVCETLVSLGMMADSSLIPSPAMKTLTVMLDGKVVGVLPLSHAETAVARLRIYKIKETHNIPSCLEIALVLPSNGGLYPGLFLFSSVSRMMRHVKCLRTNQHEMIGTFEQVYMTIAITPADFRENETTHQEIKQTDFFSVLANLIPFPDYNQSPRNMYQCQMAKQSMGTPVHSYPHRSDNKMYRIQTPQSPLVRTNTFTEMQLDDYPIGTNAIVAVISYTGYDLEDAMIINKSSFERGFGHGSVYKTVVVDLDDYKIKGEEGSHIFGNTDRHGEKFVESVDEDGVAGVGVLLKQGDVICVIINTLTDKPVLVKHKDSEPAYIDTVRFIPDDTPQAKMSKVTIKLRYNRNPIIGDKFSSRHGQKGVLSFLWPQADMPFSESGMSPDVIINPHAFPSRMTIGMLVESMAGKSGALHGIYHNATPFRFDEKNRAVDYFGEQLRAAGYNYYGNEPMYSGTTGQEFKMDIYLGVVYYQRLRHMVSDKFQVRSSGPVNQLTHQPIKGRKMGGGIRFGEMERDSLLAHGASFLLHDRLMTCSDYHAADVCARCGSMMSIVPTRTPTGMLLKCRTCRVPTQTRTVYVPYVFVFLLAELAAMNIGVALQTE
eukprot:TRINITY_DN8009_c0_g1_i1.p1 TRINITY_DN8009_c0_g1~~TRINITY_DN8009_c0_g1_i1.p1  ORF type:complete len:1160 (-),score=300.19 TRINITY_DN8009_c0_g1_i1:2-3067(-)